MGIEFSIIMQPGEPADRRLQSIPKKELGNFSRFLFFAFSSPFGRLAQARRSSNICTILTVFVLLVTVINALNQEQHLVEAD